MYIQQVKQRLENIGISGHIQSVGRAFKTVLGLLVGEKLWASTHIFTWNHIKLNFITMMEIKIFKNLYFCMNIGEKIRHLSWRPIANEF